MRVNILLFGPLSQAASSDAVSLDIQGETTTAGDVLQALRAASWFPRGLGTCRLAVNHAFADDATPIRASDEVALIGMVSGG